MSTRAASHMNTGYLNGTGGAATEGKTRIEPLPAVDHSTITYSPFRKAFYSEHRDITGMSAQEVDQYRGKTLQCNNSEAACCALYRMFPYFVLRAMLTRGVGKHLFQVQT